MQDDVGEATDGEDVCCKGHERKQLNACDYAIERKCEDGVQYCCNDQQDKAQCSQSPCHEVFLNDEHDR